MECFAGRSRRLRTYSLPVITGAVTFISMNVTNSAHWHLMLNHAPLFGLMAAILLLTWGVLSRSREMRIASYVAFLLTAVAAMAAYITGNGAERIVEDLPGVTKAAIERHQDAATFAVIGIALAGIASVGALVAEQARGAARNVVVSLLFAVSLGALAIVSYTANLGGLIHHTEITATRR